MATSRPSRFPSVPYQLVRCIVGWQHVGTPDAELTALVGRRLARITLRGIARKTARKLSPSEIREALRFALACHEDNRREYRRVMGGAL
jgi:hypothetical protein